RRSYRRIGRGKIVTVPVRSRNPRVRPSSLRSQRGGGWARLNQGLFAGITRRRACEPGLQPQDRLRVQLRDARLGDPEHLADLSQRQLLVVVERDDELLALGQARDRLAERLLQLRLRKRGL